jgi:uncharacterized RDD family membrane protein YckC
VDRVTGYGEGSRVPPGAFNPPERPQRLGADVVYAEWWKRVVAAILDGIIVGGAALLVLAALGAGFFSDGDASTGDLIVGGLLFALLFGAIALLYAPIMMARTNGKTLGKLALGIRVARANGKPIDFWWAVLREVAVKALLFGIAASVTGGLSSIADWLWPLFDSQSRALHDFVVDSRVIKS